MIMLTQCKHTTCAHTSARAQTHKHILDEMEGKAELHDQFGSMSECLYRDIIGLNPSVATVATESNENRPHYRLL